MTFVAPNLACGEARGGRIPGHGAVTDEQRSHRPNSAQPGGRQVFFAQTSLLAPYRSTAGYARRSRLVWTKNPLPRTSSYLCLRPLITRFSKVCRTPKASPHQAHRNRAPAFWSAVALYRFHILRVVIGYSYRSEAVCGIDDGKAAEVCGTPRRCRADPVSTPDRAPAPPRSIVCGVVKERCFHHIGARENLRAHWRHWDGEVNRSRFVA